MTQPTPLIEADQSQSDRQRRINWEAEMIAEADAKIAAGWLIDEAEIDAWIDRIGTDQELPPPCSDR